MKQDIIAVRGRSKPLSTLSLEVLIKGAEHEPKWSRPEELTDAKTKTISEQATEYTTESPTDVPTI